MMAARLVWHARALAAVAIIRISLWVRPFASVTAACARPRAPRVPDGATAQTVARVVSAVGRVSRVVPHATCLCQALAAQRLLSRAGIASDLTFGVRRHGGDLEAHAWLEVAGQIVMGDARAPFTPLRPHNARDDR